MQEFFAGRGIPSREHLETVIDEDWWQRAIVFFFGENPENVKGLQSARDSVLSRTDPERYRAAITIGLALQACYLVELTDKTDILKWVLQVLAHSKDGFIEGAKANGAPDFMAFIWYYLFGKEAVACSIPSEARAALRTKIETEVASEDEREVCEFWQLVGMLETALDDDDIEKLIRRYEPKDRRMLFALFLNLKFIEDLRVSTPQERAIAKQLAARLHGRVASVAKDFLKEFRSMLLEVRDGQVQQIEAGAPGQQGSGEESA